MSCVKKAHTHTHTCMHVGTHRLKLKENTKHTDKRTIPKIELGRS